ncbi:2OG-Fe(II) oxygenase [Ramlibacter sp. WS9]|uniref:2OG-Fe(II) oxygenase n=1 Tax=Ramlibacter sp. WS9 TaxID=1882741 RepID=UPI0011428616|nr:2OG-Fe(II) oxygenase [Ramlibacter sp. WS9]ROZ66372.1 2OG-Fe(II) oxygenase [Ramlibacter sp. WS9]
MSHYLIPGLLGPDAASGLLNYAIANEARFQETTVGTDARVKHTARRSRLLTDIGPYRDMIEKRVAKAVPELIDRLGLTPFQATGFEVELVAHGDGAFYRRHIDVFTGSDRAPGDAAADRLISLVYYLHREPKGFSGGELRLYPQIRPTDISPEGGIDVVPQHDMAVAFSSWLPHEVRAVTCPTGQFGDARFAVNCWVLRQRAASSQSAK